MFGIQTRIPRNGTSLDNLQWDNLLSLFPGTKIFSCPAGLRQGQEQKLQDKLLCPGLSQDKITFPKKPKDNFLAHLCYFQKKSNFFVQFRECPVPYPSQILTEKQYSSPSTYVSLCPQKTQHRSKQLRSGFVFCSKYPGLFQNSVAAKIAQLGVSVMQ